MDSFYCIGCRTTQANARVGKLTAGAHRDGDPVGFCFTCLQALLPELVDEADEDAQEPGDREEAASA